MSQLPAARSISFQSVTKRRKIAPVVTAAPRAARPGRPARQPPARAEPLGQQLLVALAGAVEDAVELQPRQAEVAGDALLVVLGEVEAEQDLAVALVPQLLEDLADEGGVLARQQSRERPGVRRHGGEHGVAVGVG